MLIKVLKLMWFACCIAILAVTLSHDASGPTNDIGIFLAYTMLFLTFPAGCIVVGVIVLLVVLKEQLGFPLIDMLDKQYIGFSVTWFAFLAVGYLQWFVLLPWLWRKWKARRLKPKSE